MKLGIKKRDIVFFILGIVTILLIDLFSDWDNHVKAFKDGYNAATHDIEQIGN